MFGGGLHAGLDYGGSKCAGALIDHHARLIAFYELPIRPSWTTRDLERLGTSILEQLCAQTHTKSSQIKTCGIGVPGPVKDGSILTALRLPAIERINPRRIFPRGRFVIENDVLCAAHAERMFGHLAKSDRGVLFMIGSGCGATMVERVGEHQAKKTRFTSVEIGHICASMSSVIQETVKEPYIVEGFCSRAFFQRHTKQSIERLLQRAEDKDAEALELFARFGAHVGATVATIETLFKPDHIIIGGGLSRAFRFFASTMRRIHALRRFPQEAPVAIVSPSSFGAELGAYGAAITGKWPSSAQ